MISPRVESSIESDKRRFICVRVPFGVVNATSRQLLVAKCLASTDLNWADLAAKMLC